MNKKQKKAKLTLDIIACALKYYNITKFLLEIPIIPLETCDSSIVSNYCVLSTGFRCNYFRGGQIVPIYDSVWMIQRIRLRHVN